MYCTAPQRFKRSLRRWLHVGAAIVWMTLGAAQADSLRPGKGVKVQPLNNPAVEEYFQTMLVLRGLEQLGYEIQAIREVEHATAHVAIANGDATFYAAHWHPNHADFYKNSGGAAKLHRASPYVKDAAQGYLIDKKTADAYGITNIGQLQDPKLAKLFDADGDGKADLTGCTPGWGCEPIIEHQLDAFKLRDTVTHKNGNYPALMADVITRYRAGQPILYYTWTPFWVSSVLQPGRDVVWLEVPFSAAPGELAKVDTRLPNGKNYGFTVNTIHVLANKAFTDAHPDAAKLFEVMQLPLADINAQNNLVAQGQNKLSDIERHVDGWIRAHRKTFDDWVAQARAAAR